MKYILFLLLFTILSCQEVSDKKTIKMATDSPSDSLSKPITTHVKTPIKADNDVDAVIDSVVDRIYHLDKVQLLNAQKRVSILTEEPDTPDDYYNFKVGFNTPDRFETRYIFSFKKKESIIYYYDVVNDQLIDAYKWSKEK